MAGLLLLALVAKLLKEPAVAGYALGAAGVTLLLLLPVALLA